jgi:fermentation-respiration switch protein FrsA (DUF1100 family)
MIVAERDTTAAADVALATYGRASDPKRLVLPPGAQHFDVYHGDQFTQIEQRRSGVVFAAPSRGPNRLTHNMFASPEKTYQAEYTDMGFLASRTEMARRDV